MAMPSSPRLPSPPPPAEIQIGPKSPSMGPNAQQAQQIEQTQIDAAAKRRIHPGTRAADMAAGPPLVPLNELDSAFQLQEHLAALHYHHTRGNTVPITRETAKLLATPPPGIDRTLWLYELCRFLIAQCNSLIVGFLFDTPPCSAATCPEMRASEWQFLCAVHDAPKSCCAIDYCCHTLDWAANVVTNPKIFPSRFVAPPTTGEGGHDKSAAVKNLVNVFRRLHRIFAHAWFQHRGVFWSVEGQTGLYVFFKTVCDLYDLLPAENYKLPPEAEGLEAPTATGVVEKHHQTTAGGGGQPPVVTAIASRPPPSAVERSAGGGGDGDGDDDGFGSAAAAARTNTRRHIRSNPSTGNAISMVPEVDEDDQHHSEAGGGLAGRMKKLNLASPPPPGADVSGAPPGLAGARPKVEEGQQQKQQQHTEAEAADVPVIVLDEGRSGASRRETVVETRETTEDEKGEGENVPEKKQEQHESVEEEEKPLEAKAGSVVVENELETPVPEPSVEDTVESASGTGASETGKEGEEEEVEDVGDETLVPPDDDGDEPFVVETKPEEVQEEVPPVAASESKDLEEAVAKDDPAAAAAVVAADEEKEHAPEETSGAAGKDEPKDEKPSEEETKKEED
ncbi:Mob1/phocein [Coniochaeta hoffmannii]|uniref:Mob1/phocein n=1 Tax=Coniochaeta hoffmannii TaxID=91930 RepID=A0AA38RJF5_9PEZI|nr:Mob1/phocein [Coniochaeta hoffmannii]